MLNSIIKISIIGLFLLFSQNLPAQIVHSEIENESAVKHINQLKDGILIVMLPTNKVRIKALNRLAKENPTSDFYKNKAIELRMEAKKKQRWIVDAYEQAYLFSKIAYLPDSMFNKLYEGKEVTFVNPETLELDNSIKVNTESFYTTQIGITDSSVSTGKRALIINDKRGNQLGSPFPYATAYYEFFQIFIDEEKSLLNTVTRQQKNLSKFLYKVQ